MQLKGKTFDGVKLSKIVNFLESEGAKIRTGGKHRAVVTVPDYQYSCALGKSTGFKKHIMPWMKKALNYEPQQIYGELGLRYT